MSLQRALLLLCIFLLAACGGGGGGGGSSSAPVTFTAILVDTPPVQQNIAAKATHYYRVDVQSGYVLTFTVKTISGDADLAVYTDPADPQNSLIGASLNTGTADDVVQHTATQTGTIYVEVGGFLASQYTLEITTQGNLGNTPVISAAPAATVIEGNNFAFQVLAQVPNDPSATFTYKLLHGPRGMSIDALGNISWIAHGAIFDTSADVHYAIRVQYGNISSDFIAQVTVLDPLQAAPIMRSTHHGAYRYSGVVLADLDNDNKDEILMTDGVKRVSILEESGGSYEQTWMLPINYAGNGSYRSVNASELNGDNTPELIITAEYYDPGTNQDFVKIIVLDGQTRKPVRESAPITITANAYETRVADIDNDGNIEIIHHSRLGFNFGTNQFNSKIFILDAQTLALEWTSPDLSQSTRFAIGQLDADPYPEIALNGGDVYAYNGTTYVSKWNKASAFGNSIAIGDIDNDQIGEIVTEQDIYSLGSQSAVLTLPPSATSNHRDVTLVDYDGDNDMEIVASDTSIIYLYDYNALNTTLNEITRSSHISPDQGFLLTGNSDSDSGIELVYTRSSSLFVSSLAPGIPNEWDGASLPEVSDPFFGGHWAQLNAVDSRAIFAALSSGPVNGVQLFSLDSAGKLDYTSSPVDNSFSNEFFALATNDYDSDSTDEIILGSHMLIYGYLTAYDYLNEMNEWTSASQIGDPRAIVTSEVNNDGIDDVVVIMQAQSGPDVMLQSYDGASGTLIGSILLSAFPATDIGVADLDNDQRNEIIIVIDQTVSVYGPDSSGMLALEGSVNVPNLFFPDHIVTGDIDGDTVPEIIVVAESIPGGQTTANIVVLDNNLNIISSRTIDHGSQLTDVTIEPGPGSNRNLVAGFINSSNVYGENAFIAWIDPYSGEIVSRSPDLAGRIQLNSLHMNDINGDGQQDLIFGSRHGVHMTR